jgi:hypothetical protein
MPETVKNGGALESSQSIGMVGFVALALFIKYYEATHADGRLAEAGAAMHLKSFPLTGEHISDYEITFESDIY